MSGSAHQRRVRRRADARLWLDAPYVCPGCYAMGSDEHAVWCPDAAIERDLEDWAGDDWAGDEDEG